MTDDELTIDQIDGLHERFGAQGTLGQYVRGLAAIGVVRFDSFLSDGHSEFSAAGGQVLRSRPAHVELSIAAVSDRAAFLDHLARHERGETGYVEMSRGLADSGVERWTVDTAAMTMTFLDRAGQVLLVDPIEG